MICRDHLFCYDLWSVVFIVVRFLNFDSMILDYSFIMDGVHTRSLENKPSIILNEFEQPIRLVTETKDYVSEFSRFLDTIARDYNHTPLTIRSWLKVPNKKRLWDYVLVSNFYFLYNKIYFFCFNYICITC